MGVLTFGGEGLLILAADSAVGPVGLFALNKPVPGSRAGTDLARPGIPSLSDYSQRKESNYMNVDK